MTQAEQKTDSSGRLRFFVMVGLLVGTATAVHFSPIHDIIMDRDKLMVFLEGLQEYGNRWWTPLALFGLFGLISPLAMPVSPLVMAGGVIFGTLYGGIINLMGCMLGLTLSFYLAKALGRDFIMGLGFKSIQKFEAMLQAEQSFWLLVRLRFLPIPFPVFNFGAALTGIPFRHFFLASFIGLVPTTFAYTYFAAAIASSVESSGKDAFYKVGAAMAILFVVSFLPKFLNRKKEQDPIETNQSNPD